MINNKSRCQDTDNKNNKIKNADDGDHAIKLIFVDVLQEYLFPDAGRHFR